MKFLLLALTLTLAACVQPDCVIYVNGKPVYSQCHSTNDSDKNDRSIISTPTPDDNDHQDDDHNDNNGNGSHSHDDSNGDNSD
jgi:hypothetical protein